MDQEMHRLIFLSLVLLGVERLIIFILYTHRSTPVSMQRLRLMILFTVLMVVLGDVTC